MSRLHDYRSSVDVTVAIADAVDDYLALTDEAAVEHTNPNRSDSSVAEAGDRRDAAARRLADLFVGACTAGSAGSWPTAPTV